MVVATSFLASIPSSSILNDVCFMRLAYYILLVFFFHFVLFVFFFFLIQQLWELRNVHTEDILRWLFSRFFLHLFLRFFSVDDVFSLNFVRFFCLFVLLLNNVWLRAEGNFLTDPLFLCAPYFPFLFFFRFCVCVCVCVCSCSRSSSIIPFAYYFIYFLHLRSLEAQNKTYYTRVHRQTRTSTNRKTMTTKRKKKKRPNSEN